MQDYLNQEIKGFGRGWERKKNGKKKKRVKGEKPFIE
jgi:hypothetical protein